MQPQVGDKLGQGRFTLGRVFFQSLRAVVAKDVIFPLFIFGVKLTIALDMVDQAAVAVPEVLPPLVAVQRPVESEVNAKAGLFVLARLPWHGVQLLKEGVGLGQRHFLAVVQRGVFAPNDGNDRLHSRVMLRGQGAVLLVLGVSGGGLGLDARLYQIIQLPVFLLIARPSPRSRLRHWPGRSWWRPGAGC